MGERTPTLEQRVKRLEDRWALSDLVHDYGLAVDGRDMEALTRMFTRDAVLVHSDGVVRGREAVIEYYHRRLSGYGPTYHYAHTHGVEIADDGEEATGVVAAHAELSIDGETIWIALRYHDDYVREDGAWRFRSRRQQFLYVLPLQDLPSSLGDQLRKRWPGAAPARADIPEGLPTYGRFGESR